jgi:antitoxin CcdA
MDIFDRRAPKRAANLSVNSDLLRRARELDINLSALLDQALEEAVRRRLAEQWTEENRQAIAEYNADVAANGVFGDDHRAF